VEDLNTPESWNYRNLWIR